MLHSLKLVFFSIFALAGTFFLFMAIREGSKPYRLLKYGIETEGVVTGLYKRPMRSQEKSNGSLAPVVLFFTDKGVATTYYSTTFTNPPGFETGQKVKVWYDAKDPKLATLEGKDNWILVISFGIFGLALCAIFYSLFLTELYRKFKGHSS
jgi:hypothetical protein